MEACEDCDGVYEYQDEPGQSSCKAARQCTLKESYEIAPASKADNRLCTAVKECMNGEYVPRSTRHTIDRSAPAHPRWHMHAHTTGTRNSAQPLPPPPGFSIHVMCTLRTPP